jgi:hypothetical protein
LHVEAIGLEVSRNVFESCGIVLHTNCLADFLQLECSEEFAFGLEDQDVGLLLQVEDVVLKEEVFSGIFSHLFDILEGLVKIVVFVDGFEEK